MASRALDTSHTGEELRGHSLYTTSTARRTPRRRRVPKLDAWHVGCHSKHLESVRIRVGFLAINAVDDGRGQSMHVNMARVDHLAYLLQLC